MCFDPVTAIAGIKAAAASVGTALGSVGTAVTIGSGVLSAYSQVQNSRLQAQAAARTAQAQEEAARQALEQGEQESDRRRQAGAAMASSNMAAMAANGLDVSGAQALDILDDTRFLVEEDAFAIRENARRRGEGFSQAAANSMADAASARRNAFFAPVQTLLSTASTVGRRYASWVPEARRSTGAY